MFHPKCKKLNILISCFIFFCNILIVLQYVGIVKGDFNEDENNLKEEPQIIVSEIRQRIVNISIKTTRPDCFKEIPSVLLFHRHHQEPEGNGSSKYFMKFKICCEGYKRDKYNWNICVPDCGCKCKNGFCIVPDMCECYPGFAKNLDGECVETCPLSCLNGKCHSNGICTCEEGFKHHESKKFCQPGCTGGCKTNQNCTLPEHCECIEGYRMNSLGECEFYCKEDCAHGNCIGPNKCKCKSGYKLKDGICQANCTLRCNNGICIDTDRCICKPGYRYDYHTTTCLPVCKKCVNGTCVAPGCCKCFENFKKVRRVCTHKRKIKS